MAEDYYGLKKGIKLVPQLSLNEHLQRKGL